MAFAISTKKAYSSHLKSYLSFCRKKKQKNYASVPVSQSTLLRYTAFLSRRLAPQSIPAYLNVIRLLHLEANMHNPLPNNFLLDTLLKGIRRDKCIIIKQALPMTPNCS